MNHAPDIIIARTVSEADRYRRALAAAGISVLKKHLYGMSSVSVSALGGVRNVFIAPSVDRHQPVYQVAARAVRRTAAVMLTNTEDQGSLIRLGELPD